MGNPFDLSDAVIRELPYVRVTRHGPKNGRGCEYRKNFKPHGLGNADYWIRREHDFLLDFALKRLRHTVEFSTVAQASDGFQPAQVEMVATRDAGITIADWMRIQPRYEDGDTLKHPFRHASPFLELLRACLVALKEINRHGIVHGDIKDDNICLPYTPYPFQPGQPLEIDFERIRLIDFAFSITRERPLERPLPIAANADYQSRLLKDALDKDRSFERGGVIHAQQLDYRVDLYSLGYMAGLILEAGLLQPQGSAGPAAVEGAQRLVERLKAFDYDDAIDTSRLPHDALIGEIDALLMPLTDRETYRRFMADSVQAVIPYSPTPLTPMELDISNTGIELLEDSAARILKTPSLMENKIVMWFFNKVHHFIKTLFHPLAIAAELITLALVLYAFAMKNGELDGIGICQLVDEDEQIRDCRIFGIELWTGPSHYPPPELQLPTLSFSNAAKSADGLLAMGTNANQYQINQIIELQFTVTKPIYLTILNHASSGEIETVYPHPGDSSELLTPGKVYQFPPPESEYEMPIEGPPGRDRLIAIASEKSIPTDVVLVDGSGKLTERAKELSPTVVRVEYAVIEHRRIH